jgi:predicted secreted protein
MKTSTKVLLGVGAIAAVSIGYLLLSAKPAATQQQGGGGGGGPNVQGQLPKAISLAKGASAPIALPEVPSTGRVWIVTSSDPAVAAVSDDGWSQLSGAGSIGSLGLHKFTVKAVAVGSATLSAVFTGPDGKPVPGMAGLSAPITVTPLVIAGGVGPHFH